MPTKTPPKARKPKAAELARYCELRDRKRKLESEARGLESEINQLADLAMSYLEEIEKTSATIHGYRVITEDGRAYVSWKDEFVRVAGSEAVTTITANAPRPTKLTIVAP